MQKSIWLWDGEDMDRLRSGFFALLLATTMSVTGCGGSSSSSGGSSGNGDGPGNGGGTGQASPSEVFSDVAALSYSHQYSGEMDWANIDPVYGYEVSPAEQPQRVMVDSLMLGHTMATALHAIDRAVLQQQLGGDDDFYDFLEMVACDEPGTISVEASGAGQMNEFCVLSERGADRMVRMSGTLSWTDDPDIEGATRQVTMDGLNIDVEINGNWVGFQVSGAVANRESAVDGFTGSVLMAWDADHLATDQSFRFYRRWNVDLQTFDELAFHSAHGALAMPGDGLYAGGSEVCDAGGRSNAATVALAGAGVSDAQAILYVAKNSCGAFYIDSSTGSTDSNGDFIRPELYGRFLSLFPGGLMLELDLDNSDAKHFEITENQSDVFQATEPAVGYLGRTVVSASDWTVHQLALEFDLLGFAVSSADVIEAQLRLAVGPDGVDEDFGIAGFNFMVAGEWAGDPGPSDFVDPFSASDAVSFQRGVDETQSWAIADITDFLVQALNDGRGRLQLVIYASMAEPGDPAADDTLLASFCLGDTSGCDADRQPNISVVGQAGIM